MPPSGGAYPQYSSTSSVSYINVSNPPANIGGGLPGNEISEEMYKKTEHT